MTEIKCLQCEHEFYEEHLALTANPSKRKWLRLLLLTHIEESTGEFFKGCPYCKTDGFLQDLPTHEVEK